ncbi:MAG: fatty acid desaturase [Bacteriovorax sp.]|nr:fatty acid desaturase [Bacteriovorax sp.]
MRTSTAAFLEAKKNPLFLLKHYLRDFFLLSIVNYLLYTFHSPFHFHPQLWHGFLFLFSIPTGWIIASFLHNTGHGNIKSLFINNFLGEFCGHFVGYGFTNFILVHTLHHNYSDQQFDPVSPEGMSFLCFALAPTKYMIARTKDYLLFVHGKNKHYKVILNTQTVIFYINLILRLIFWFLLLGPHFFLFFYLPAVASNILILAHINYVCHRDFEDGSVEVFNMDHNLYYKIANFITIGGYYHKSHHLKLNLFDPRNYKGKIDRPLLTINPNPAKIPLVERKVSFGNLRASSRSGSWFLRYFDLDNIWIRPKNVCLKKSTVLCEAQVFMKNTENNNYGERKHI